MCMVASIFPEGWARSGQAGSEGSNAENSEEKDGGGESKDGQSGGGMSSSDPKSRGSSGHPSPKKLKEQLQREILMRNGLQAAKLWQALHEADPHFVFPPSIQFDLSRILVSGGHPNEAISSFHLLLKRHPDAPISQAARLEAARLCAPLPDHRSFALECLEAFLASSPTDSQAGEARQLLDQIQLAGEGAKAHPSVMMPSAAAPPVSALSAENKILSEETPPVVQDGAAAPPSPASPVKSLKAVATSPPEALALLPPTPTPPAPFAPVAVVSSTASQPAADAEVSPKPGMPTPSFSAPSNLVGSPFFPFPAPPEKESVPALAPEIPAPPAFSDLLGQSLKLPPDQPGGLLDLLSPAPVPEIVPSALSAAMPAVLPPALPVAPPPPPAVEKKASAEEPQRPPTEEFDRGTRILEMEKFRREQEEREKTLQYQKLLMDSRFSVLFPPGKRIHFEETCDLVGRFLEIEPNLARRKLRSGKGIVLSDLSYDEMRDFYRMLLDISQQFVFVRQSEDTLSDPVEEILAARREENGIRVTTQRAQFRVEWEKVFLLSAGKIRESRQAARPLGLADLYVREPHRRHLRILDTTFSYRSWGISTTPTSEPLRELLLDWKKLFPKAVASHTIEMLAKSDDAALQVFESIVEYEQYNRWLLLSHFGDRVDPSKLHSDLPPSL